MAPKRKARPAPEPVPGPKRPRTCSAHAVPRGAPLPPAPAVPQTTPQPIQTKAKKAPRKAAHKPIPDRSPKTSPSEACVLHSLGHACKGTLLRRPSSQVKSPYVCDVELAEGKGVVLAHVPCLDMGGLCVLGVKVLLTPTAVAPGATTKWGKPRCTHKVQLVHAEEPEAGPGGVWIGAHPELGNVLARRLLLTGAVAEVGHPDAAGLKAEVTSQNGKMRSDFIVQGPQGPVTVEVKNVVCADYAEETKPDRKACVFVSPLKPFRRAAIFPWGRLGQKYDGQTVVSERALKHLDELMHLQRRGAQAAVLFVVNRGDCRVFRACHEACPVFARKLQEARRVGVTVVAYQVAWDSAGVCRLQGKLDIVDFAP